MKITKKDIEKARNTYWLKEASRQTGKEIKSLKEVRRVDMPKASRLSLGKQLSKKAQRPKSKYYKKKSL